MSRKVCFLTHALVHTTVYSSWGSACQVLPHLPPRPPQDATSESGALNSQSLKMNGLPRKFIKRMYLYFRF